MVKKAIIIGALSSLFAIILGAFAAHKLQAIATVEVINIFQKGVQYQQFHSLAILIWALLYDKINSQQYPLSLLFFSLGILLFSGSLYLISFLKIVHINIPVYIGLLTPIGGVCFILGWLFILISAFKLK